MNTLNFLKLTFDVNSLGQEALLTAVRPYYAYVDGAKTNKVERATSTQLSTPRTASEAWILRFRAKRGWMSSLPSISL